MRRAELAGLLVWAAVGGPAGVALAAPSSDAPPAAPGVSPREAARGPSEAQAPGTAPLETGAPTTAPTTADGAPLPAPRPLAPQEVRVAIGYERAVELATADTPRMARAQARVLRAEAQVKQSRATWLPTLNGVANYTRLDDDRQINGNITTAANSLNLSLQLLVPLVVPTRWAETARRADARDVAEGDRENERRLAVVDVTRAYLAVVLEQKGVEIAQRALDTARREAEITRTREREGVGSRLEVARAEREVHNGEAALVARRAALRSAQEALGVATFSDGPVDAAGSVDVGTLPPVSEALKQVKSRPDLLALRRQAESDRKRVDDAWLDYVPTLSASAQAWHQRPPTVNFPEWGWQAQLLLVLPLYDGGKRYADRDERQANRLESRAALRQAELAADADIRATAAEADHRYAAWVETERAVQLSREALELSRIAYREGTGTQLDLIEAERSARDAETNAAIAQTSWLQAQVLYRLAAGQM